MKIYLDDRRPCPDRYVLATDYEEFVSLVEANKGNIDEISFDYDLGGFRDGLDCAEYLTEHDIFVPVIEVHSNHSYAWRIGEHFENAWGDRVLIRDI